MNVVEYPHPVLQENGDDYSESCRFSLIFEGDKQAVEGDDLVLTIGYDLECPGLEAMIADNRAVVGVLVHSPQASYRCVRLFGGNDVCVVRISKFDVVGKLEVQCLILANQPLRRFSLPEYNQLLFEGATFDLRKGDILALSEKSTLYLDSSDLEKPLTSIFVINRRDSQEAPIQPDYDDETGKIAINLSGQLFQAYSDIQSGYAHSAQRCITCSIVLPVLIEAIELLRVSEEGEYSELRWARVIQHKLAKLGIDLDDSGGQSVAIANQLLGDVIDGSLDEMVNILWANSDTEEDEGGHD